MWNWCRGNRYGGKYRPDSFARLGCRDSGYQGCRDVQLAGIVLKVIFETSYLSEEETGNHRGSIAAGADFVKTSTGFGGEGHGSWCEGYDRYSCKACEAAGRDPGLRACQDVCRHGAAVWAWQAGAARLLMAVPPKARVTESAPSSGRSRIDKGMDKVNGPCLGLRSPPERSSDFASQTAQLWSPKPLPSSRVVNPCWKMASRFS